MRRLLICLAAGLVVLASGSRLFAAEPGTPAVSVTGLRCEYQVNPLGIDELRPRLGWILQSSQRGQKQTAYQVLVASSADALQAGNADLWDSGKVESPQSVHVVYPGKPLTSGLRAHWRVRVWDKGGAVSTWSEPAWWEMGLLERGDWRGKWISAHPPASNEAEKELAGAKWIWTDEGDATVGAPEGERFFRTEFISVPRAGEATLIVAADDEFVAYVNGKEVGRGHWPQPLTAHVEEQLNSGVNILGIAAKNLTGSAGLIARLTLIDREATTPENRIDSTTVQTIETTGKWMWRKDAPPNWNRPGPPETRPAGWKPARELVAFGERPWGKLTQPKGCDPAPYFRKEFQLLKTVKTVRAYICGLGYHELYLNGRKVGNHVLDPAFTRYDKRALYVTHDVTELLKPGRNAAGIVLGTGWFNQHAVAVWNFDKAPWRDHPQAIAQINVEYEDGTREQVATDASWRFSAGPILMDGLFLGQTYDARLEKPEWDSAGYDEHEWKPAYEVPGPAGRLVAQSMPPIRVVETIKPVKVTQLKPGVSVYDMGQAFAGWAAIDVTGPAGSRVVMKYGERLNADGSVRQNEISSLVHGEGFQTDTYICKGAGTESWEPRFNYHGYRWVQVTETGGASVQELRGRVVHTDYAPAGQFECSDPLLNRILQNTRWSYGANFQGYPTDCPHREKNGWTGDAHLASEQAMYNFNNVPAYEKWMNDFFDEQRESGELPGIVPTGGWGYHWGNGPAWDSAYVLIPWYLYEYYADVRVLERHYPRMRRYVDYLTTRAKDHIVDIGLGDWVHLEEDTPVAITSTGYYHVDATIVAKAAQILGKTDEADKYAALAAQIRQAFNEKFGPGNYAGTQTGLSCALYQGLAPDEGREQILKALVADVEKRGNHLNAGILGTKYLLHALSDNGRADLAYAIVAQKTYPSWGHWIEQGATTLWEDWKGEASRMHIMFGDVSAWMYSSLAGICPDPQRPGFEHVILRPDPVGDLTWVKAEYRSIRGPIVSAWKRDGNTVTYTIQVPANCTATLYLPAGRPEDVREGAGPANSAEGVAFVRAENSACVYELQSGSYEFSVAQK